MVSGKITAVKTLFFDSLGDDLGHILELYFILDAHNSGGVGEHLHAVGAFDGQNTSTGAQNPP
jgi:hypothetical protein